MTKNSSTEIPSLGTTRTMGNEVDQNNLYSGIEDSVRNLSRHSEYEVKTNDPNNIQSLDLRDHYITLTQEAMEEWFSKPREGIHVSDVILCPRQKVYREIDRRPIEPKTVSIYAIGKSIHEAYQALYRSDKKTFEIEKFVEFKGIQGSVDIYDRRRNIPIEFKTTRASSIQEPKSWNVEQLRYYMAILGAKQGVIIYQLLMHFGNAPFKAFIIRMNGQERKNQRDKLVYEANSLNRAMKARNPALARSVDKDVSLNWLCKDCLYLSKCQKIQQGVAGAA